MLSLGLQIFQKSRLVVAELIAEHNMKDTADHPRDPCLVNSVLKTWRIRGWLSGQDLLQANV